jgi:pyrroloquinoline quinone (PQQ) biosynthesis protein C
LPAPMSEDAFIDCIKTMRGKFSQIETPLVRAIATGAASREQITRLGVYFAFFTRVTPNELGNLIGRTSDSTIRREMVDTLIDEDTGLRCGDKPHIELALDFATRFSGMSLTEVAAYPIPYEIQDMNHFRLRLSTDEPIGIARTCLGIAGEGGFGYACAAISDGLRKHYGVKDEDQQSWIVHIEGEEVHSAGAETIGRRLVRTVEEQRRCIRLCAEYLDRWQIWYGLCYNTEFRLRESVLQDQALKILAD